MKSEQSTEIKARSQTKKIINTVGREFFQMYCDENNVLKESMDDLLGMVRSEDDNKLRFEMRKYLVDQLIGRAKQSTDVTSKGEKLTPSLIVGNITKGEGNDEQTEE